MLKGVWTFGLWCIVACILLGCGTHYQWTKSHPAYRIPPRDDLAVVGADKAFVLIRSAWFAKKLNIDRQEVNRILYSSPLMKELCWQDREYRWHGIMQQKRPHTGLQEFAGYYDLAENFLSLTEEEWLKRLTEGCTNIGRNLNDTRGLFHSFRDCRKQIVRLFMDLLEMIGEECLDWELAFELRLKQSRHVRIYADVLIITENRVFSLEFKMKNEINPEELLQAAKYSPYLEILFGPEYEVIPVLVLTETREKFEFVPFGKRQMR